jgi:hypothetical protein
LVSDLVALYWISLFFGSHSACPDFLGLRESGLCAEQREAPQIDGGFEGNAFKASFDDLLNFTSKLLNFTSKLLASLSEPE